MEQNYPFQLAAIAAVKEKYFDAARIVKEAIISSRLKLFGQDDGNFNSSGNIHSLQGEYFIDYFSNQIFIRYSIGFLFLFRGLMKRNYYARKNKGWFLHFYNTKIQKSFFI